MSCLEKPRAMPISFEQDLAKTSLTSDRQEFPTSYIGIVSPTIQKHQIKCEVKIYSGCQFCLKLLTRGSAQNISCRLLVLWVCWQVGGKVRGWQVGRVEAAPAPHQVSQGGTFDKELVCSRWSGGAWPGGSKLHSSLKSSRRRRSLGGGQACQAAHLCALLHPSHLLHQASTTNDFNNTTLSVLATQAPALQTNGYF